MTNSYSVKWIAVYLPRTGGFYEDAVFTVRMICRLCVCSEHCRTTFQQVELLSCYYIRPAV